MKWDLALLLRRPSPHVWVLVAAPDVPSARERGALVVSKRHPFCVCRAAIVLDPVDALRAQVWLLAHHQGDTPPRPRRKRHDETLVVYDFLFSKARDRDVDIVMIEQWPVYKQPVSQVK